MRQPELKKLIKKAIVKSEQSLFVLAKNDNPQVMAMVRSLESQLNTLRAVLDAINNNAVMLRIMAG